MTNAAGPPLRPVNVDTARLVPSALTTARPPRSNLAHQRRHLSGRAARGSVSLRKMACRSAAGARMRFKAIDAR
jgi:hypothetical protein